MQYFTPGYYFSGGGESGDSDSCLSCDEYQGLPHTVQFPTGACGTQVSFFLYLHSLWGSCNILKQLSTVGSLSLLSLSPSHIFPFFSFPLSLSQVFCLVFPLYIWSFLTVFLNFNSLSLLLDYILAFSPSMKLNKMVKFDLLLNLISTSNLFTNASILSDSMMINFFLEWHNYSPWGVRDQLILSTSLSMYNPTLLLQCTQWMVSHIIDTYN